MMIFSSVLLFLLLIAIPAFAQEFRETHDRNGPERQVPSGYRRYKS
jgi:hypothetical protein